MAEQLLKVAGVAKSFGGTLALSDVDLTLHAGEMLALVGANGAGKSTLVKIICGVFPPDAGAVTVAGKSVVLRHVTDALKAGIAVAHQQVAIIRTLTGAQNIMLGREPLRGGLIDERAIRQEAQKLADRFGVRLDLARECDGLNLGEMKILDILKALANEPRVLILDEPTASLTLAESQQLFAFLAGLKTAGLGILFISHHMAEIFAHCDRVVVLKDGRRVHDGNVADTTLPDVVRMMVGRAIEQGDWASHARPGATMVRLRDMVVGRLRVPALDVHGGEVVGIAGVLGAGQTEFLERVAGVAHPSTCGEASLGALHRLPRNVAEAIDRGIFLVADDRLRKAIFRGLSVEENVLSGSLKKITPGFFLRPRLAATLVRDIITRLRVKCSGPRQEVLHLSGGNQQKIVFGRWLTRIGRASERAAPTILLLDNPTEGVDVGSKAELYALVRDMASEGAAILIASAEFSELIALCDRVYCITDGALAACLPRESLSEDRLLSEVN